MLAFARPAVTQVLLTDHPIESSTIPIHGYDEQLRAGIPWAFGVAVPSMTCAGCAFFDASRGWCTARQFETKAHLASCDSPEGSHRQASEPGKAARGIGGGGEGGAGPRTVQVGRCRNQGRESPCAPC